MRYELSCVVVVAAFTSLGCLGMGGCAKIDYVKVPTPTQYQTWTDADQKRADGMKGVRYYLPRPFLHLKEPTPVAQRVAFVSFRYETREVDGKNESAYFIQFPADPPTWLLRVAPEKISVTQALAAQLVHTKTAVPGTPESDDGQTPEDPKPKPSDAGDRPPSELTARTGFISDTDPVTRLGDRMDIVYLPDFEEQFVIQTSAGLGQIDIETRLRNGWAAEVFSQQLDNSNLIPYVIRQVERASEAAAGIVTTWLPVAVGLPPGTSPAKLAELAAAGGAESDTGLPSNDKLADILGHVIVFKVAEVKIAQPGVYPILKPREVRQWMRGNAVVSGRDPQESFELFLQQNQTPWIRPDMAFIPVPPFTMVGFNVTTDVFILPATERIDTAPAAPKKSTSTVNGAEKAVRDALLNNLGPLGALKSKFKQDSGKPVIAVASEQAQTVITLDTVAGTPLALAPAELDQVKNWIKTTLQVNDGQLSKAEVAADGSSLRIDLSVSTTELAEKIKGNG